MHIIAFAIWDQSNFFHISIHPVHWLGPLISQKIRLNAAAWHSTAHSIYYIMNSMVYGIEAKIKLCVLYIQSRTKFAAYQMFYYILSFDLRLTSQWSWLHRLTNQWSWSYRSTRQWFWSYRLTSQWSWFSPYFVSFWKFAAFFFLLSNPPVL